SQSKQRRALTTQHPLSSTRRDGFHHWPKSTTKGRCRNIGCHGYSTIICSKCQLRLCINSRKNCFERYHK
ncbi:unnamed protein product, partial [Adineta steineri]